MVLFYAVVVLELVVRAPSSTWTEPDLFPVTVYLRNLIAGATGGTSIQGGGDGRR